MWHNKRLWQRLLTVSSVAIFMHQGNALRLEKKCRKCGGINHFSRCCNTKKRVQVVEEQASQLDTSEDEDLARFYIGEVKDRINDDEWITHLDINGTNVALKMDTGAQANVLPWKEFIKPQMKPKISHRKQSPLEVRAD